MPERFRWAVFLLLIAIPFVGGVELSALARNTLITESLATVYVSETGPISLLVAADVLAPACGHQELGQVCGTQAFILANTIKFAIFPLIGIAILKLASARRSDTQMVVAFRSAKDPRQSVCPDTFGGVNGHSRLSARVTVRANRIVRMFREVS